MEFYFSWKLYRYLTRHTQTMTKKNTDQKNKLSSKKLNHRSALTQEWI